MKKFFLTLILLSASLTLFAQMMPDSTLLIRASWREGSRAVYDCMDSYVQLNKDGEEELLSINVETRIFDVLENNADSFVLQTTFKNVETLKDDFDSKVENYFTEKIVLNTRTDRHGHCIESFGEDETLNNLKILIPQIIDAAIASYDDGSLEKQALVGQRDRLINRYATELCNKKILKDLYKEDVEPLFKFHGKNFEFGKVYSEIEKVGSIIGMWGAEMETEIWLDTENSDRRYAVVHTYSVADTEVLTDLLVGILLEVMNTVDPNVSEANAYATHRDIIENNDIQIAFEQYSTTVVHLASGWPLHSIIKNDCYIYSNGELLREYIDTKEARYIGNR